MPGGSCTKAGRLMKPVEVEQRESGTSVGAQHGTLVQIRGRRLLSSGRMSNNGAPWSSVAEPIRTCTHIKLRVPEGKSNVAGGVNAANRIQTVSRGQHNIDFSLLDKLDVMIHVKGERSMRNRARARANASVAWTRSCKRVFSNLELKRQDAVAYGSNEVGAFVGHDLRRKIRYVDEELGVVGFIQRHRFPEQV